MTPAPGPTTSSLPPTSTTPSSTTIAPHPPTHQQPPPPPSPVNPDDLNKWLYKDPQGEVQGQLLVKIAQNVWLLCVLCVYTGPFQSPDMRDWFNAGYFTMDLMIKRVCDTMMLPLGTLYVWLYMMYMYMFVWYTIEPIYPFHLSRASDSHLGSYSVPTFQSPSTTHTSWRAVLATSLPTADSSSTTKNNCTTTTTTGYQWRCEWHFQSSKFSHTPFCKYSSWVGSRTGYQFCFCHCPDFNWGRIYLYMGHWPVWW